MKRGFVEQLCNDGKNKFAVIVLEDQSIVNVPCELLPDNIEIDDFIIFKNNIISIDPDTDNKKEIIKNILIDILSNK